MRDLIWCRVIVQSMEEVSNPLPFLLIHTGNQRENDPAQQCSLLGFGMTYIFPTVWRLDTWRFGFIRVH